VAGRQERERHQGVHTDRPCPLLREHAAVLHHKPELTKGSQRQDRRPSAGWPERPSRRSQCGRHRPFVTLPPRLLRPLLVRRDFATVMPHPPLPATQVSIDGTARRPVATTTSAVASRLHGSNAVGYWMPPRRTLLDVAPGEKRRR
jgi:hypothetical protein